VRPTADGARIDVRSASRYGRSDFGTNAARIRTLLEEIDGKLAAAARPREPQAPAPPARTPAQQPQAPQPPSR
jgi:hypothetical protein